MTLTFVLEQQATGARDVVLVAPYVKERALQQALSAIAPDATLLCVTRWQPHDVVLGASDVQCREIVLSRGGQFLLHPTLHAKYYRFNDRVLIGSANLTLSGMGWGGHSNFEILAAPSDAFDYKTFETEILAGSRPVSDTEYEHWAAIQSMPQSIISTTQPRSDRGNWRPLAREFENFSKTYYGRLDEIASSDESRRAQSDIRSLSLPPNLESDKLRSLVTTLLVSAAFVSDAIRVQDRDSVDAARELSRIHALPLHIARYQMETVHNWLRELAPELLPSSENP